MATTVTLDTTPAPLPDPSAPVKPEGVPDKFWKDGKVDVANLAKSYTELEKARSTPAPVVAPAISAAPVPVATLTPETAAAAGVDLAALSQEYLANNKALKPESLAALAAKGISAETVKSYISGQEAAATAQVNALAAAVGGIEPLQRLYEWANANLSAVDKAAYDAVIKTGNPAAAAFAIQGLQARHVAAVGKEPALVSASAAPVTSGIAPFESAAQMTEAMRDPKYAKDPAYRKSVEQRIAVSKNLLSVRVGSEGLSHSG